MYTVGLIHRASDSRGDQLTKALLSQASSLVVPLRLLDWKERLSKLEAPTVIVYLGTETTPGDAVCAQKLRRCVDSELPILPVVEGGDNRFRQTPEELRYVKHMTWHPSADPPEDVIAAVFEMLGVSEKERRVFISYRQSDATKVAVALFHKLSERRFSVFLDQFTTRAGEDIQGRIDEAMEEMAFVVLLHSPEMHLSKWIDWEVTHALRSSLPILIVRWSRGTVDHPKLASASFPTIMLDPEADVKGDRIEPAKLDEILGAVEEFHADGLLRRRRQSLLAAGRYAKSRGWDVAEDSGSRLLLTHPNGKIPTAVLVTPRLATPEDLFALDQWMTPQLPAIGLQWSKVLLQASTFMSERRRRLIEWVVGDRQMVVAQGTSALAHIL